MKIFNKHGEAILTENVSGFALDFDEYGKPVRVLAKFGNKQESVLYANDFAPPMNVFAYLTVLYWREFNKALKDNRTKTGCHDTCATSLFIDDENIIHFIHKVFWRTKLYVTYKKKSNCEFIHYGEPQREKFVPPICPQDFIHLDTLCKLYNTRDIYTFPDGCLLDESAKGFAIETSGSPTHEVAKEIPLLTKTFELVFGRVSEHNIQRVIEKFYFCIVAPIASGADAELCVDYDKFMEAIEGGLMNYCGEYTSSAK